MLLTSPSFEDKSAIPSKFTCDGGNINPELLIQNVPENAKSLALIVDDPDIPDFVKKSLGTEVFDHWLVWNIDPKTEIIKQESKPPGLPTEAGAKAGSVEGKNSRGKIGYTGPCPPDGEHRYFFKLYALDAMLNLPEGSSKSDLETEIKKYLIEKAELLGVYKRV